MTILDRLAVREAMPNEESEARAVAVADAAFQPVRVYRLRGDVAAHEAKRSRLGTRLIAIPDGTIVGTVQFEVHAEHVHLIGLAVRPEHQRRGIARALVNSVAQRALALGRTVLALDTVREAGNVPRFMALGFRVVSERPADIFESDTHLRSTRSTWSDGWRASRGDRSRLRAREPVEDLRPQRCE